MFALKAVATDNAGNTATSSSPFSTTTVDNTVPVVAVANPATSGSDTEFYDSGSKTLYMQATGSGSFNLKATASDGESGISSVTFPTLFGTSGNPATGSGTYTSAQYSFDGTGGTPISSPGSATITASNGVTDGTTHPLTATDAITITADATKPTSIVQFPVNNGRYDTSQRLERGREHVHRTRSGGNICGTVTDNTGGSGVASVTFTLQDTTTPKYWNGTSFGSSTTGPRRRPSAGRTGHTRSTRATRTSRVTTGSRSSCARPTRSATKRRPTTSSTSRSATTWRPGHGSDDPRREPCVT